MPAHESQGVGVAIVGAGKIAKTHAAVLKRLAPAVRVVAIADPVVAARDAIGATWPEARRVDSLAEVLSIPGVRAVHLCTPPETHVPLAMQAIEAGRHVYVEKPVAPTAAAARDLFERAAGRGVQLCAGHQLLHDRATQQGLRHLAGLGDIVHVESYFAFRPVRRAPDGGPPQPPELQLLDILPHPAALLVHFLGRASPGSPVEIGALEVGDRGTVHALARAGVATGSMVVSLGGRPVDSYLRVVGTRGALHIDLVRSTIQVLFGQGSSAVDKILNPYRLAWQLAAGTSVALARRFLARQSSYAGMCELFEAFYASIERGGPAPVPADEVISVASISEAVTSALHERTERIRTIAPPKGSGPPVVVTGGTGLLGTALVRQLSHAGRRVRVLARREPPSWERVPGVEYRVVDLSTAVPAQVFEGADTVVHCAAATSGGWQAHERHSIGATRNVLQAAATAGAHNVVHVSSLAVLAAPGAGIPLSEATPLEADPRSSGPYVWGKLESERLAATLGAELGLAVKIVRPAAIIDDEDFDPPGRLGRQLGPLPLYLAIGRRADPIGSVSLDLAARTLVWYVQRFDDAPPVLNLLDPSVRTAADLVRQLKQSRPELRVMWLPPAGLRVLALFANLAQRFLRPGRPRIDLLRIYRRIPYDTSRIAGIAERIEEDQRAAIAPTLAVASR